MVQFRPKARELIAKVVYYGPPLGGKTTNLRAIFAGYPPDTRGELVIVPTGSDRTIFFDFLPISLGTLRNMRVRVQLYTVPGQVRYNATRQIVLRGVDGVVFVADSQRAVLANNRESWENLKDNLLLQGIKLAEMPHVVQYNKRDLKDIADVEELDDLLNEYNAPFYEAIALQGIGVEETLQGVVKLVVRSLRERFQLEGEQALTQPVHMTPPPGGGEEEAGEEAEAPPDVAAPPEAEEMPVGQVRETTLVSFEPEEGAASDSVSAQAVVAPFEPPGVAPSRGAPDTGEVEIGPPVGGDEEEAVGEVSTVAPPVAEEGVPFAAEGSAEEAAEPGLPEPPFEEAPPAPGVTPPPAEEPWGGPPPPAEPAAEEPPFAAPEIDEAIGGEAAPTAPPPATAPEEEVVAALDGAWTGGELELDMEVEAPAFDSVTPPPEAPTEFDAAPREAAEWPVGEAQPSSGEGAEPAAEPGGGAFEVAPPQDVEIGKTLPGVEEVEPFGFGPEPAATLEGAPFPAEEHAPPEEVAVSAGNGVGVEPPPPVADEPFALDVAPEDPFAAPSPPPAPGTDDVFAITPAPAREIAAEPETLVVPVEVSAVRTASRALAQYGEVRELELEVPVPAPWTGGRRMTLQLRLTLVPQEEGDER